MSLYVHFAFFLAIALFMQLDADVLDKYLDIDLDSNRSDRDHSADVDLNRRLQEEDEVGGFGLQIQLITDDGFVPESPESSSSTSAIVLVLLVATVMVLVGSGLRHCVVRKGAVLSSRKKKTYDVEEVNINNFQNYEPNSGRSSGNNSATGSYYYSDSTSEHDTSPPCTTEPPFTHAHSQVTSLFPSHIHTALHYTHPPPCRTAPPPWRSRSSALGQWDCPG